MTKNLLPTPSISENNVAPLKSESVKFHLFGKRILFLAIGICFSLFMNAQVSKTVNVTAGNLSSALTTTELETVTDLTLTGTIDGRDFVTMRDNMPLLETLDLSGVSILQYVGFDGPSSTTSFISYPKNTVPDFAFYRKISLRRVIVPSVITSIGTSAFASCNNLTLFDIPSSVTSIGDEAFCYCNSLTSITIPSLVTSIGYRTFDNCSSLSSIDIPSSVTSIGIRAFSDCSGLTSINIPSSVTSIGGEAFSGCYALTSITIPPSVTKIGYSAFSGCIGLTSVNILSSSVLSIDDSAFFNCFALTSITIPQTVTSIGRDAFGWCRRLTSINIQSSVTSIGSGAFSMCEMVNSIQVNSPLPINLSSSPNVFDNINKSTTILKVPSGSKSAYQSADQWKDFTNIVEMTELLLSANSIVFGTTGGTTNLSLGSSSNWSVVSDQQWLKPSPVSGEMGTSALTLTATANTDTITRTALITVTAIGFEPRTITVNQYGKVKVTAGKLKDRLAGQLSTISSLTLTGTIDARDFKTMRDEMPMLEEVDLSETTIVEYKGLEGPDGSNSYINSANTVPASSFCYYFLNLPMEKIRLRTIILPSFCTTIGKNAFRMCKYLSSVGIPISVVSIEESAFEDCKSLSSVTIPPSVVSIGIGAFEYCTALTSVCIPPSVVSIGDFAFAYCSEITSLSIPSSVITIGIGAFQLCKGLTSLNIPSSVKTIGMYSFRVCTNLTSINIPSSVTSIGGEAFYGCDKVSLIQVNSTIPINLSASPDIFLGMNKTTTVLKVPSGSKSTYQTADQWKDFLNIVEFETGTVANAGPDQIINEGQVVTLDGTNSKSANIGSTLSYKWTAPSGIILSSEIASNPSFIAPEVSIDTAYTFELTVNDGSVNSTADHIIVTVKQINKAPLANAGADQTINETSFVTLDGSASIDPDNDKLSFLWTAPAGITLSSEIASNPTFIAPQVSIDTVFTFELIVNDGYVNSITDQLIITVKQLNKAPIANAGTNQSVNENSLVTLDGSASSDPDQDELSYLWTAPAEITLSSETAKNPTFTAPEVNQDNIYRFILVVNDGKTDSDTSQVSIIVKQVLPVLKLVSKTNESQIPSSEVTYQFYIKKGNSFYEESLMPVLNGDTTEFSLEPGEWIILASPAQNSSTFVPTYLGNTIEWINAEHIIIPEKGITFKEITCFLPEIVNKGTGQISGYVYKKTDPGTKSISMTKTFETSGNPVPGALIRLFKKGNAVPVLSIFTDAQGYYKFDQLEVLNYQIVVEIPGFTQSEKFEIAISSDQLLATVSFGVNTSSLVITDNNPLLLPSLKIYPNPVVQFVIVEVERNINSPYSILGYSIDGELLINQAAIETKTILDLSRLLAGTYTIQVCSGAERQSSIVIKR